MNREIKFRAWDNVHRSLGCRMVYHAEENNLKNLRDFWQWVGQHEPMPVMQFTGLTDKDGKEIWEGDIVACEFLYAYSQDASVFNGGVSGCVEYGDSGSFGVRVGFYFVPFGEMHKPYVSVLGNKWENPELINDAKYGRHP